MWAPALNFCQNKIHFENSLFGCKDMGAEKIFDFGDSSPNFAVKKSGLKALILQRNLEKGGTHTLIKNILYNLCSLNIGTNVGT